MWNGIFVRLWYAEITDEAGSGGAEEEIIAPEIDEDSGWKTCPGIGDAGIPGWFDGFFVSKIARFAYARGVRADQGRRTSPPPLGGARRRPG